MKWLHAVRRVPGLVSQKILSRFTNRQFLFVASIFIAIWAGLTAVLLKTVVHYLQIGIHDGYVKISLDLCRGTGVWNFVHSVYCEVRDSQAT